MLVAAIRFDEPTAIPMVPSPSSSTSTPIGTTSHASASYAERFVGESGPIGLDPPSAFS